MQMSPTIPIAPSRFRLAGESFRPDQRDVLDTQAIIGFLRRNRQLCLMWIFAALCCGIAFIVFSPDYYSAYTTVLLEDRTLRPPTAANAGAGLTDPAYVDSQVQVLVSDEVVERVVDQNRLDEDREFGNTAGGLRTLISNLAPFLLNARPETPRHAATVTIKRALSVRRVGISNAVEIGFTSRNPARASMIANAIAQTYIDSQRELSRQARADAAAQLWDRLAELRNKAFAVDDRAPPVLLATPEAGEQAQQRFRELQNNAETYRLLYNSFLQRGYTDSLDGSSSPDARVITSAVPPIDRSWPRSSLVLAIAVACGAAGGLGHACLRQALGRAPLTVEDVRLSTGLDQVVGIPMVTRARAWKCADSPQQDLQPAYTKSSAGIYVPIGRVAVRLQEEPSRESKSIIAVAAAIDGAGASSIAAHLAKTVAGSGQRTLLVDANWRRRWVGQESSSDPRRKLAGAMTTIDLEADKLDVLTLRAPVPVSELNASLSIIAALQWARSEYDYIVVDFHAAGQTADLEVSMSLIDKVIVVAEAGRTSSENLRATLRLVPREKIAALVLNKISV
jgi:Mrp family chromosome partitioning ATPase